MARTDSVTDTQQGSPIGHPRAHTMRLRALKRHATSIHPFSVAFRPQHDRSLGLIAMS